MFGASSTFGSSSFGSNANKVHIFIFHYLLLSKPMFGSTTSTFGSGNSGGFGSTSTGIGIGINKPAFGAGTTQSVGFNLSSPTSSNT